MPNSWYNIDFTTTDTPALIIDKAKVTYNIQWAIEMAGGTDRLRPHVKTHKILEVAKMQVAAGIHKFKCATIAEAEMLGMAEAKDVLLAYPIQGPKINRIFSLQEKYPDTQYSVLIDNEYSAKDINKIGKEKNRALPVFIDVDNGQHRTGIPMEFIEQLVTTIQGFEFINIVGLHCYDGHIRMSNLEERTKLCMQGMSPLFSLHNKLEKKLDKKLTIVAGGSPSFSVHAKHHPAVECSPGTFVFWDQRYGTEYQEQEFEKAAVVATRVISKIDAYTYCLDLGHKSVASEFPFPRVEFIHPEKFTQVGQSEEHLTITCEKPDVLKQGELLLAFPYHICPTVALYDQIQVVEDGAIKTQWDVIARNRKITI